jgi:hypothetical protein
MNNLDKFTIVISFVVATWLAIYVIKPDQDKFSELCNSKHGMVMKSIDGDIVCVDVIFVKVRGR